MLFGLFEPIVKFVRNICRDDASAANRGRWLQKSRSRVNQSTGTGRFCTKRAKTGLLEVLEGPKSFLGSLVGPWKLPRRPGGLGIPAGGLGCYLKTLGGL